MDPARLLIKTLVDLGLVDESPQTIKGSINGPIRELARLGLIDEVKALGALSAKLYIDYIDVTSSDTLSRFDPKLYTKIDKNIIENHRLLPLWEDGDVVTIGVTNPFDLDGLKEVEFLLGKRLKPVLVQESKLFRLFAEHNPAFVDKDYDGFSDMSSSVSVEVLGKHDSNELDASEVAAPPIVRLTNKIIADAVERGASDIHIEPGQDAVEIRFRVDGVMASFLDVPKRLQPYLLSRLKLISGMDISERRKPQDGRLRVRVGGVPVDMRASVIPTPYGEKLVYRILGSKINSLSYSALGVPPGIEQQLLRVTEKRGKLFLVTGPTGSGKTTMLYTMLNYLRDGKSNIQTVEDPVEYRIPGINQIQVDSNTGVSFASALRSILRQDPDIIMIGEIRDEETANIALQAAQTGHLVLSTLHTNDPLSAITRLLNLGVDRYLLGSSLEGVIAQRLVRILCEKCKQRATDEYLKGYEKYNPFVTYEYLKMAHGCPQCHDIGYRGRTGIYSYLDIDENIEELIYNGKSQNEIREAALANNYTELHQAALALIESGQTTFDEVKAYLPEVEERVAVSVPNKQAESVTKSESRKSSVRKDKVLLVEDDFDAREILSLLLESEMYDVIQAENGREALEIVYNQAPDVVLCDLMMPVMDGREFLKKMKSHNDTKTIPVVLLTAVDTEGNELELLELGAEDFIGKNVSSAIMLTRVRKVLERSVT